jgi:hypothetical protein
MTSFLRQATASQSRAIGPFVDSTDFSTPETGLTIANTDIKLVVNGAASANKNSGGGTHRVNGVYGVTFDATDTATVGEMEVSVVVAGALPVFHKFVVVEEAVYDALFAASAAGFGTAQTGDSFARLGAPVGASISADIAGVQADTDNIQTRIPAALVGGKIDANVGSMTAGIGHDVLDTEVRKYNTLLVTTTTAIRKALTKVSGGAAQSGDWTPASGDVKISKDGGAEANPTNLPSFVNGRWEFIFTATELSCKILTVRIADSATKVILDADFEVYTFGNASAFYPDDITTAAATDASIADAVWEEAIGDHDGTAGSTAEALSNAGAAGTPPTTAEIADAVWDEVQSGHTTPGTFGLFLDSAVSGVSTGGVSAADIADAVWDEALSGHTTAGTAGKALGDTVAAVDTEVAAIKAKTDNLPTDPADASDIAALIDALPTAAENATAVWGAGARTLTTLDEDSTTLDLDATIRAAVGLATANLDTQLSAIDDFLDTEIADIRARLPAALTANGNLKVSLQEILTTALTETSAGQLAAAFKKWFDVSSPVGTVNSIPNATAGASGGIAIVGSAMTLAANAVDAATLTPAADNEIADALLDRTSAVESGVTVRQVLRLIAAVLGGKSSGLDTGNPVFRNLGDSKDVVTSTADADGNRTSVTTDLT